MYDLNELVLVPMNLSFSIHFIAMLWLKCLIELLLAAQMPIAGQLKLKSTISLWQVAWE